MNTDMRRSEGRSAEPTVDTLDVPGARLYYEVRGSGPVLLMIPGGPMDAAGFAGIAPLLADGYTVVTYDPRGLSRSTRDNPDADVRIEDQADDAYRLMAAVGTGPAYVLASSGGGITGLALVARHPDAVRTLVAHEPPITELLPDREQHRANGRELDEAYRSGGAGAAMAKFMEQTGLGGGHGPADAGPEGEPDPEMVAAMARMQGNFDLFFGHMLRPLAGFLPDVAALHAAPTRIVVAGGTTSTGEIAQRAAVALAELLDTKIVDFPGDHGGFGSEPAAFAEKLREVLSGR